MPHSHAATAAGGNVPPDGPGGRFHFHEQESPTPPTIGFDSPELPAPIIGHEYNVIDGPAVHQIDHSLNFGDVLSEEQALVAFEIQGIGRVYFGLTGKSRLHTGAQYWEITGLTAEFVGGVHVGIFKFDVERKIGTVIFAR